MQTRVGYAGAATEHPLYRNLGGHAEVLRVVFDPAQLSYPELLTQYYEMHEPRRSMGQYRSLLIASNAEQQAEARSVVDEYSGSGGPEVIEPGTPESRFWDAEAYHQKYRLRRNTALTAILEQDFGADWDEHSLVTKLNAVGGAGFELKTWVDKLSPEAQRAFRRG